jgi:hypothetical protein
MLPAADHPPVAGLKTSAVASRVLPFTPPATSTRPSARRTATCAERGEVILPVETDDPEAPATLALGGVSGAVGAVMPAG